MLVGEREKGDRVGKGNEFRTKYFKFEGKRIDGIQLLVRKRLNCWKLIRVGVNLQRK